MSSGIFNKHTGHHNRRSIRLPGYDYSQPGYHFVTICIHNSNKQLFGNIISGNMELNDFGCIVQNEIIKTEQIRPNVKIDEFIIMPNHCHIIYHIHQIDYVTCRGELQRAPTMDQHTPTVEQFGKPTSNSIPTVVRLTKSTITKQINLLLNTPGKAVWQRNYFEHIIRDNTSLFYIKQYIQENPHHWENDFENHIRREIEKFKMIEIEEF
jgi:REP element-mobilizing transposase RayT